MHYDPDLLASLAETPIGECIPVQALYRLPGWGLFVDCPFISDAAGVFACLDPGTSFVNGAAPASSTDELMFTFVLRRPEVRIVQAALRLSEGTFTSSLAAQERDRRATKARAQYEAAPGEPGGRHVAPHLRRAHCLVNSAAVSRRPVRGNCECGQRLYPHRGLRVT